MPFIVDCRPNFNVPKWPNKTSLAGHARRADTGRLQEKFLRVLPGLPQIAVRGQSDMSQPSTHSHLISAAPIGDLLTEHDLKPLNFLARLFITTSSAFNYAARHAGTVDRAQNIILSFYLVRPAAPPMTEPSQYTLTQGFSVGYVFAPGLPVSEVQSTFPHYALNQPFIDIPVAELRYESAPYFLSLKDSMSRRLAELFIIRRDAIIYRDMLRLFCDMFGSRQG
jgi:hypothetical protein